MKYKLIELYLFVCRYIGINIFDIGIYHRNKIDEFYLVQDNWINGIISYEQYIKNTKNIKWLVYNFSYDVYNNLHENTIKRYCVKNDINFDDFIIKYYTDIYEISEKNITYQYILILFKIFDDIMVWYIFDTYFNYKVSKRYIKKCINHLINGGDKVLYSTTIQEAKNNPILFKYYKKYLNKRLSELNMIYDEKYDL